MRTIAVAHASSIEEALAGHFSITLVAADNPSAAMKWALTKWSGFAAYHGDAVTGHRADRLYWHTFYNNLLAGVVIPE